VILYQDSHFTLGTGDTAAVVVFHDVCGRSYMTELLVNDTTGKTAMLTMNPGPQVDFGVRCKDAVANLVRVSKEVWPDKPEE
jgi:predicted RNA-binding protein (virulence factor B family)